MTVAVHHDAIASWWTVAALTCVALGSVAPAVLRRARWRGGPGARPRVRWQLTGAVLALALAGGVAVNTWAGLVPDVRGLRIQLGLGPRLVVPDPAVPARADADVAEVTDPPPTGHGTVGHVRVPAPAALAVDPSDTWVYTPPGFDASGRTAYPLLVLLHGSPGGSADWFSAGAPGLLDALITSGEVRPMIVVAPDVNARDAPEVACLDSTRGGSQVESYLQDVVVPWVDAHYPVAGDRRYRAIGGMSAGAYCALDQGLRHSADVATVLAIMPYGEPGAGGGSELSSPAEVAAHSPSDYVGTIPLEDPTAVFLAYGSAEPDPQVGATARDLAARLTARGQPVELRVEDGLGHTWRTATTALPAALAFFETQMADPD
jgi:enterochelin esterase-like enzyme